MAGRRTNLALLVLLAGAVGTGALAFALGSGWAQWAVVGHGVAAIGMVLLAPWKSAIVRNGLRRQRPGSWASLILSLLVAVALVAGIAHGTGLLRTLGGRITAMQVHVGAALACIPFAIWHVLVRKVRPRPSDLSRRTLLRAGVLAGASLAAYGGVVGLVRLAGLSGRRKRFTGSYETGSFRPEEMPVTQWLFDHVPRLDGETWRLSLQNEGREIGKRSLGDLEGRSDSVRATIDCTGGWNADQDWEGVRLDLLLPEAADAQSILARSATGYNRRFPAVDASRLWLVTRVGGQALSAGHGYPARIVAPGRRGFWWVKWVVALEVSDTPWWWQPPFPVQ